MKILWIFLAIIVLILNTVILFVHKPEILAAFVFLVDAFLLCEMIHECQQKVKSKSRYILTFLFVAGMINCFFILIKIILNHD